MSVLAVIRTERGSVTVVETANGIGSPVLEMSASEKPPPLLSTQEVGELRDVLDKWLESRGRR